MHRMYVPEQGGWDQHSGSRNVHSGIRGCSQPWSCHECARVFLTRALFWPPTITHTTADTRRMRWLDTTTTAAAANVRMPWSAQFPWLSLDAAVRQDPALLGHGGQRHRPVGPEVVAGPHRGQAPPHSRPGGRRWRAVAPRPRWPRRPAPPPGRPMLTGGFAIRWRAPDFRFQVYHSIGTAARMRDSLYGSLELAVSPRPLALRAQGSEHPIRITLVSRTQEHGRCIGNEGALVAALQRPGPATSTSISIVSRPFRPFLAHLLAMHTYQPWHNFIRAMCST